MRTCLQKTLSQHCGPVLLGKKPSALFPLSKSFLGSHAFFEALSQNNLVFEILRCRGKCSLVMVYHPALLYETLQNENIKKILKEIGYPSTNELSLVLSHLRYRFGSEESFPHEVGFFLGYPAEDVAGFIQNKGKDYKFCGMWKVYGNVARAKKLFCEYEACKTTVLLHIEQGGNFCNLRNCTENVG